MSFQAVITLRIPPELRERIRSAAFEQRRSMNEWLFRLAEQACTSQEQKATDQKTECS